MYTYLCGLAFILLLSSILMNFFVDKKNKFKETLNNKQKLIYKNIINERLKIYIYGMILGLLLGFIYYYFYNDNNYRLCKFIIIIIATKLLFYYFYPKSDLMLYHINTKEQVKAWGDVYMKYKKSWKMSLIISIFAYILLFKIININK